MKDFVRYRFWMMNLFAMSLAAPGLAKPLLQAHFTVKLIVSSNDSLKSIVENDMTRALQKLGDVEVTNDAAADWLLYVNVVPIVDAKGIQGYIFSTLIADQYSANTIKNLPPEDYKSPETAQTIKNLIKGQVNLRDHWVQTCRPADLQKTYSQIVNNFDEIYLAPARNDIQDFNFNRGMK